MGLCTFLLFHFRFKFLLQFAISTDASLKCSRVSFPLCFLFLFGRSDPALFFDFDRRSIAMLLVSLAVALSFATLARFILLRPLCLPFLLFLCSKQSSIILSSPLFSEEIPEVFLSNPSFSLKSRSNILSQTLTD